VAHLGRPIYSINSTDGTKTGNIQRKHPTHRHNCAHNFAPFLIRQRSIRGESILQNITSLRELSRVTDQPIIVGVGGHGDTIRLRYIRLGGVLRAATAQLRKISRCRRSISRRLFFPSVSRGTCALGDGFSEDSCAVEFKGGHDDAGGEDIVLRVFRTRPGI
jgi:hypothetical protein